MTQPHPPTSGHTHAHSHEHCPTPHHENHHGHNHGHEHGHPPFVPVDCAHDAHHNMATLKRVMVLTGGYFIAELVAGFLTNSLTLLADAGHMLTDLGGVALALFAAWLTTRPAPTQRTFGYYRMEILAAFINGLVITGLSLWLVFEAIGRIQSPEAVAGEGMLWVAIGGLVVNLIAIRFLHNHHDNMNLKAAYLHVLGDLLGSVGTIVAAVCITWFGWTLADPIATILISILIMVSAIRLINTSVSVLMEVSPAHIDVALVKAALCNLPEVQDVHHLHIWTITSGRYALSARIVVHDTTLITEQTLDHIHHFLQDEFQLHHVTLQLETPSFALTHPSVGC